MVSQGLFAVFFCPKFTIFYSVISLFLYLITAISCSKIHTIPTVDVSLGIYGFLEYLYFYPIDFGFCVVFYKV